MAKPFPKVLRRYRNPNRAALMRVFFQTHPGGYGEGDDFLGIPVPTVRLVARSLRDADDGILSGLLDSRYNEERLLALLIMAHLAKSGTKDQHLRAVRLFRMKIKRINNWNLVDASAYDIIGRWLVENPEVWLQRWSQSRSVWERRIAIVATMHFIRCGKLDPTFEIARMLLKDDHDLIHKATGWLLREAGKKSSTRLVAFLRQHQKTMPRTMLRYAIERLPKAQRIRFLAGRG